MKKTILVMVMFLLGICSFAWAGGKEETQNMPAGIYMGIIPAADCPGIAVVAIFNTEGNYKITYQYIDRSADVLTFTGTYTWDGKTKIITLDAKDLPPYYMVKKHSIIQLDLQGNKIEGKHADLYKLRKVRFPD